VTTGKSISVFATSFTVVRELVERDMEDDLNDLRLGLAGVVDGLHGDVADVPALAKLDVPRGYHHRRPRRHPRRPPRSRERPDDRRLP